MRTRRIRKIKNLRFLFLVVGYSLFGQDSASVNKDTVKEVDVTDLLRKVFNKPPPKPASQAQVHFAFFQLLAITQASDLFLGAN